MIRDPFVGALVSDVHGNRWALEAVLEDIRRRRIDVLLNLGDALYGPLDPRGTAALLRAPGMPAHHIRGNQDRILYESSADPAANSSLLFTRAALGEDDMAWVRALPAGLVVDEVRLCHGTPASDEIYLLEEVTANAVGLRGEAAIAALTGDVRERVLVCGHTHVPRVVRLPSGPTIVNPGSVGLPAYGDALPHPHRMETGSPHARYAILRIDRIITIELVAIEYDWETAANTALKNGRPDWALALRTGRAAAS